MSLRSNCRMSILRKAHVAVSNLRVKGPTKGSVFDHTSDLVKTTQRLESACFLPLGPGANIDWIGNLANTWKGVVGEWGVVQTQRDYLFFGGLQHN